MVTIDNEVYGMLKQLRDYQRILTEELTDNYVNGFYDGIEIVIAAIEQRPPQLTEVNPIGEALM